VSAMVSVAVREGKPNRFVVARVSEANGWTGLEGARNYPSASERAAVVWLSDLARSRMIRLEVHCASTVGSEAAPSILGDGATYIVGSPHGGDRHFFTIFT
jgi:hypothetical protein